MEDVLHSLSMCELSPYHKPCHLFANKTLFTVTLQSCSTLALIAFNLENSGSIMTVSQSLNIVYHSPAQL